MSYEEMEKRWGSVIAQYIQHEIEKAGETDAFKNSGAVVWLDSARNAKNRPLWSHDAMPTFFDDILGTAANDHPLENVPFERSSGPLDQDRAEIKFRYLDPHENVSLSALILCASIRNGVTRAAIVKHLATNFRLPSGTDLRSSDTEAAKKFIIDHYIGEPQ